MHILTRSLDKCMPGAFPEQEGPWQGITSLFGIFVLIRRGTLPLSSHSAQPGLQSAGWVSSPTPPRPQPSHAPPASCPPVDTDSQLFLQPWPWGQVQGVEGDRSLGKSNLATQINPEVCRQAISSPGAKCSFAATVSAVSTPPSPLAQGNCPLCAAPECPCYRNGGISHLPQSPAFPDHLSMLFGAGLSPPD